MMTLMPTPGKGPEMKIFMPSRSSCLMRRELSVMPGISPQWWCTMPFTLRHTAKDMGVEIAENKTHIHVFHFIFKIMIWMQFCFICYFNLWKGGDTFPGCGLN